MADGQCTVVGSAIYSSDWLVVTVYLVGCSFEQIEFNYYELTVPPSNFDYPTTYIIGLVM